MASEPQTGAGRALLAWAKALDQRMAHGHNYNGCEQVADESVAAIEAEAAAAERARLAALVEGLPANASHWDYISRSAVLRVLSGGAS